MLYEFLQRNEVDTKAVSIITDGVKKGEANLLGIVHSDIPGLSFGRYSDDRVIAMIPIPGGDPGASSGYTGLTKSEYDKMIRNCSYDDQMDQFKVMMEETDILISYNIGFLTRFLDPDMFPLWNIFDVCREGAITDEIINEAEDQDSTEQMVQVLLDRTETRSRSACPAISFKEITKNISPSIEATMQDEPGWKIQHEKLRQVIMRS